LYYDLWNIILIRSYYEWNKVFSYNLLAVLKIKEFL